MKTIFSFDRLDRFITKLFASTGIPALRISVGVVFLWFGFLKFFPGVSSAESLAVNTARAMSFSLIPDDTLLFSIAALETFIGLGLVFGVALRLVIFLLAAQMVGTFAPLAIFPAQTFTMFPWIPTLEGQYIIKNLVLISAAIAVGATVRGGRLVAEASPHGHKK